MLSSTEGGSADSTISTSATARKRAGSSSASSVTVGGGMGSSIPLSAIAGDWERIFAILPTILGRRVAVEPEDDDKCS